jgi:transposase
MVVIHVELERILHVCPACGEKTMKVHDYRLQKIKHLKLFERMTQIWYKRRRYACTCGKRFSEKNHFVQSYQRAYME